MKPKNKLCRKQQMFLFVISSSVDVEDAFAEDIISEAPQDARGQRFADFRMLRQMHDFHHRSGPVMSLIFRERLTPASLTIRT
jgi:hypothetical protein